MRKSAPLPWCKNQYFWFWFPNCHWPLFYYPKCIIIINVAISLKTYKPSASVLAWTWGSQTLGSTLLIALREVWLVYYRRQRDSGRGSRVMFVLGPLRRVLAHRIIIKTLCRMLPSWGRQLNNIASRSSSWDQRIASLLIFDGRNCLVTGILILRQYFSHGAKRGRVDVISTPAWHVCVNGLRAWFGRDTKNIKLWAIGNCGEP